MTARSREIMRTRQSPGGGRSRGGLAKGVDKVWGRVSGAGARGSSSEMQDGTGSTRGLVEGASLASPDQEAGLR